jgi:pyruvate,orthophosphate dikinase
MLCVDADILLLWCCVVFVSQVQKAAGTKVDFKIGTMIEVPRGALIAGTLAKTAEFFSFGTNDLTQMTFGISRDDAQVC